MNEGERPERKRSTGPIRLDDGSVVVLRPYHPDDAAGIAELGQRLAGIGTETIETSDPVGFSAVAAAEHMVAACGQQILGQARLVGSTGTDTGTGRVHCARLALAVDPEHGGTALAAALVEQCLEQARQSGLSRIELAVPTTSVTTQSLLRERGFVIEGERRLALRRDDGSFHPDLIMAYCRPDPGTGCRVQTRAGDLRCEPYDETQVEQLVSWLSSHSWPYHPSVSPSPDEVRQWLDEGELMAPGERALWLYIPALSEPVGLMLLQDRPASTVFDMRIAGRHRGRGIGRKALTWLADTTFTTSPRIRLEGHARADNLAMIRVFHACGWVREASFRQVWPDADGNYLDAVTYALLKEDWQRQRCTGAGGY
jgi:RimJ/RimL family protein N-acetyltransferase